MSFLKMTTSVCFFNVCFLFPQWLSNLATLLNIWITLGILKKIKALFRPHTQQFYQNLWWSKWASSGITNFLSSVSHDSNMYPGLTTTALGQGFSNFHVHTNHLGVLLKCKSCLSESGVKLKTVHFSQAFQWCHCWSTDPLWVVRTYPTLSQLHSRHLTDAASLLMPKQICKLSFSKQYLNFTFKCLGCNFCRI